MWFNTVRAREDMRSFGEEDTGDSEGWYSMIAFGVLLYHLSARSMVAY